MTALRSDEARATHHPHLAPTPDLPMLARLTCMCGGLESLLVSSQKGASAAFYTHLADVRRGRGGVLYRAGR